MRVATSEIRLTGHTGAASYAAISIDCPLHCLAGLAFVAHQVNIHVIEGVDVIVIAVITYVEVM